MLARDAIAFITLSACVSSGLDMRESAEYSAGRIDFLLKKKPNKTILRRGMIFFYPLSLTLSFPTNE